MKTVHKFKIKDLFCSPVIPQILGGDFTLLCHWGNIRGYVGEAPFQGDRGTWVRGGTARPGVTHWKAGAKGKVSSQCKPWTGKMAGRTQVTPETSSEALIYQMKQRRAQFLKFRYQIRDRLTNMRLQSPLCIGLKLLKFPQGQN